MKNLKNFKSNEISLEAANNVKGGDFSEWYISQRTSGGEAVSAGELSEAVQLDGVLYTQGLNAAMAQGGTAFMAKNA